MVKRCTRVVVVVPCMTSGAVCHMYVCVCVSCECVLFDSNKYCGSVLSTKDLGGQAWGVCSEVVVYKFAVKRTHHFWVNPPHSGTLIHTQNAHAFIRGHSLAAAAALNSHNSHGQHTNTKIHAHHGGNKSAMRQAMRECVWDELVFCAFV